LFRDECTVGWWLISQTNRARFWLIVSQIHPIRKNIVENVTIIILQNIFMEKLTYQNFYYKSVFKSLSNFTWPILWFV
jgi:hypothetical protein